MMICMDCGRQVDYDSILHEKVFGEYWGANYSEDRECCPYCRGNIYPAVVCEECGEIIPEDKSYYENDKHMCEQCRDNYFESEDCEDE